MANAKNTTALYVIIAALVMCLAASIGYNFGNVNTVAASESNASMNAINTKVLKEIEDLKTIYDSKIAEKKATYKDLEAEKQKVQQLLAELEQTKGDANALLKYKEEYQNLEAKMHVLVDEIVELKASKSKAVIKVKKAKPVLTEAKRPMINSKSFGIKNQKKSTAVSKTEVPITKIEAVEERQPKSEIVERKPEKVYENVYASNLKATALTEKREETNLAAKTNVIKINFFVAANENAKAEEKKYFIQIVDTNNKVMGKRITEFFDDKSITYSLAKIIQYENQYVPIALELSANEFSKGTYYVNVYEKSRIVGKTAFVLK